MSCYRDTSNSGIIGSQTKVSKFYVDICDFKKLSKVWNDILESAMCLHAFVCQSYHLKTSTLMRYIL